MLLPFTPLGDDAAALGGSHGSLSHPNSFLSDVLLSSGLPPSWQSPGEAREPGRGGLLTQLSQLHLLTPQRADGSRAGQPFVLFARKG